jgi:hypothetical protein
VEDVSGLGSGPVVWVVQGLNALERQIRGELRRCGDDNDDDDDDDDNDDDDDDDDDDDNWLFGHERALSPQVQR